ncbi:hypothetical protein [Streptomyces adustus]|uniref:hypothetical protein n=1 Tax=Streptomyces adustus TaxID=1609272 RepID=UPI0012E04224|nr:hypothetical protein [Streptomyces adustus]
MKTPDRRETHRVDEETRERSAEQHNVTAPTPRDVREKAERKAGHDTEPDVPAENPS